MPKKIVKKKAIIKLGYQYQTISKTSNTADQVNAMLNAAIQQLVKQGWEPISIAAEGKASIQVLQEGRNIVVNSTAETSAFALLRKHI